MVSEWLWVLGVTPRLMDTLIWLVGNIGMIWDDIKIAFLEMED